MVRPREPAPGIAQTEPFPQAPPPREDEGDAGETAALLSGVRLFKAAVAEGVDHAVRQICADLAAEVLARELQITSVDIDAIVQRLSARFFNDDPLRVRLHPSEATLVNCGLPVVADGALLPGDAVLELRSGSIEATLGVRLQSILRDFA